MKMTSKRVATILQRHDQLLDLARQFIQDKHSGGRRGDIRIDSSGYVEEYVNTACHCHPECEWVGRGTAEEFQEWLDKY